MLSSFLSSTQVFLSCCSVPPSPYVRSCSLSMELHQVITFLMCVLWPFTPHVTRRSCRSPQRHWPHWPGRGHWWVPRPSGGHPWSARRRLPGVQSASWHLLHMRRQDRGGCSLGPGLVMTKKHHFQGYYGDPEAECQSFHICANDGVGGLLKYTFLCPNGTIFNQQYFICDWWFNVDCSLVRR